jgi:hypothetical protein
MAWARGVGLVRLLHAFHIRKTSRKQEMVELTVRRGRRANDLVGHEFGRGRERAYRR